MKAVCQLPLRQGYKWRSTCAVCGQAPASQHGVKHALSIARVWVHLNVRQQGLQVGASWQGRTVLPAGKQCKRLAKATGAFQHAYNAVWISLYTHMVNCGPPATISDVAELSLADNVSNRPDVHAPGPSQLGDNLASDDTHAASLVHPQDLFCCCAVAHHQTACL